MKILSILFLSILMASAAATQAQDQTGVSRLDAALDAIVPSDAKVTKVADSPGSKDGKSLGSGDPVWIRDGGYLIYSDHIVGLIDKWDPADGKVSTLMEKALANGVTLDREGRIVWVSDEGQVVRVEKDGQRTVLVSEYQGKRLNSPNDLVYKNDGTLYFTDPGRVQRDKDQNVVFPDTPSVYMLKDGKLQLATKELPRPNGLAFTPDEKYLYVNDTYKMTIMKFKVQTDDTITDSQLVIDMNSGGTLCKYPCAAGYPDGMKIDRKGNIYCTGPEGIWIISPQGKHLGTIVIPNRPANLAFGDADGKTLFVTTRPGLYRIRLKIPGIRP